MGTPSFGQANTSMGKQQEFISTFGSLMKYHWWNFVLRKRFFKLYVMLILCIFKQKYLSNQFQNWYVPYFHRYGTFLCLWVWRGGWGGGGLKLQISGKNLQKNSPPFYEMIIFPMMHFI